MISPDDPPVLARSNDLRSVPAFSYEMSISKVCVSRVTGGENTEKVIESMADHPTDSTKLWKYKTSPWST